jgi:hypothetical protein
MIRCPGGCPGLGFLPGQAANQFDGGLVGQALLVYRGLPR